VRCNKSLIASIELGTKSLPTAVVGLLTNNHESFINLMNDVGEEHQHWRGGSLWGHKSRRRNFKPTK